MFLDDYHYVLWLRSIQTNLYKYGGPVIMIIGTISCVFCLMIFMKKKLRHNPCSIYLIAFNISNFLLIYTSMLLSVLSYGYGIDLSAYDLHFCHFRFYCMIVFDILSPSYLILASIDRILVTSRNALTREKSTHQLAYISILIVTLFWSLIHIHALILPEIITLESGYVTCFFQVGIYFTIMGFYSLIIKGFLVPLLMIILGLWSIKNVRKIGHITFTINSNTNRGTILRHVYHGPRKDRQLVKILLTDLITYVIFNIMIAVVLIYQQLAQEQATTLVGSQFQTLLLVTGIFSTYIPYSISFYINVCVSKLFRNKIKKIILCQ